MQSQGVGPTPYPPAAQVPAGYSFDRRHRRHCRNGGGRELKVSYKTVTAQPDTFNHEPHE